MQTVELCLAHAQVLNVFTRQFERKNVGITAGKIMTVTSDMIQAENYRDLTGQYLVPGLIDAHVHIESAMVTPSELSKALLKDGVTSIVADPHEIANVTGLQGMQYMLEDAAQAQLGIYYMAPSTVPCTPMSHNGATLTATDLKPLYQNQQVIGLSEVMDYPAVAQHESDMMQKLHDVQQLGKHADGHGAGLTMKQLEVYRRAGITTDHECTTPEETLNRIKAGMFVFLREGSVERDLENTIGVVTEANAQRFAFCTDDKLISDVLREGSIDHCIRLAIAAGVKSATAYTMASYNAAQAHQLQQLGAIAAGFQADLVVISDLKQVQVQATMKAGAWVKPVATHPVPFTENTVHQQLKQADLRLPLAADAQCHVIGIKPNHIETEHLIRKVPVVNGDFVSDIQQDILKIVVVERHHHLGTYGIGLVHGFQIQNGAVATTIAHDDHNLVAVGTDDVSIDAAINRVTSCGGGIAVAQQQQILSTLSLPVAGLMSLAPYQQVAQSLTEIDQAYQAICNGQSVAFNPFITLSFLTLPVIPTLKITDQGLYDFEQGQFISIAVQSKSSPVALGC